MNVKRYVRRKPDRQSEVLERGVITRPRRIEEGTILQKKKVQMTYPHGKHPAIVKAAFVDPRGINMEEAVVSTIDDLLGFDVVPPATARLVDPELERIPGVTSKDMPFSGITIQEWILDSKTLSSYADAEKILSENKDRVFKIAVLDFILGQQGELGWNVVVERKSRELLAIDHLVTFDVKDDGYFRPDWTTYNFERVNNLLIPSAIMKQLNLLQEGDLRAAVAPLGPQAVKGAVARWKLLKKHKRMPFVGPRWRNYFGRRQ